MEGVSDFEGRWQPTGRDSRGSAGNGPTWPPDGNTVAFGNRGLTAEDAFIELFNLKTRQLSHLLGGDKIFAPRWSPDGRYIIAISAGNNKLMLYDVKTEKWRQLNTTPDFFGYLAWSQDSAYVYFDTMLKDDNGYFRLASQRLETRKSG
jgi:Tol biopolymer transport system component